MKCNETDVPIAQALERVRLRKKLTQAAAGELDGAPAHQRLSHWETGRKEPSLRVLIRYLEALGLDLHDFQNALDQVGVACAAEARLRALEVAR